MTNIPFLKIRLDRVNQYRATFSIQLRGDTEWHFLTFDLVPGQKLIFTDDDMLAFSGDAIQYSSTIRSPENDNRYADGFGQAVDYGSSGIEKG